MKKMEADVVGRMINTSKQARNKLSDDWGGRKPNNTKRPTGCMTNAAEMDEKPSKSSDSQHDQIVIQCKTKASSRQTKL